MLNYPEPLFIFLSVKIFLHIVMMVNQYRTDVLYLCHPLGEGKESCCLNYCISYTQILQIVSLLSNYSSLMRSNVYCFVESKVSYTILRPSR